MRRLRAISVVVSVAATALLAAAGGSWAEDTLSAKLHPSGMVTVTKGDVELATIELNAHGPQWKHAPQADAVAEVSDLPDKTGKRFVGTLAIPNTDGGSLRFTESVKTLARGLQLEYDVEVLKAMKLDGLQFSVGLPAAQYAGKQLTITSPGEDGDPQVVTLPQEQQKETFQLWAGEGAKIEVAKASDEAVTIQVRAPADIVVQDLRHWENPTFEVRLPAIMEEPGRDVTAGDKFHLDLTVTFPAPVKLEGP